MICADQQLVAPLRVVPGLVQGAGHPQALSFHRSIVRLCRAVE